MSSTLITSRKLQKAIAATRTARLGPLEWQRKVKQQSTLLPYDYSSRTCDTSLINTRLPTELLLEILIRLPLTELVKIPCTCSLLGERRFGHAPTLQVLLRVCHRWRMLLLGCPKFWSSFELAPATGQYKYHVEQGREWLSRAGDCPLKVALSNSTSKRYPSGMLDFLDMVIPFHAQLHEVDISLGLELFEPFFNMTATLSRLEKATLRISAAAFDTTFRDRIRTFMNAPALKELDLSVHFSLRHRVPILRYMDVPYHQLHSLTLRNVGNYDPAFVIQILVKAHNLQKAVLSVGVHDYGPLELDMLRAKLAHQPAANCPSLVHLVLLTEGLCDASLVLEKLTAPALETLSITHSPKSGPHPGLFDIVLLDFQKRSNAPLKALRLRFVDRLHTIGLISSLKLVGETLEELIVQSCSGLDVCSVLEAMVHPSWMSETADAIPSFLDGLRSDALVPNLKRLGIAAQFDSEEQVDIILDVVGSRGYHYPRFYDSRRDYGPEALALREWLLNHKLERLKYVVTEPRTLTPKAKKRLAEFASRGLKVDATVLPLWRARELCMRLELEGEDEYFHGITEIPARIF
ncbi:hypothetical protein D9758_004237 [Tetrapyrgos nigripes]|uniref:F-box domain-containing protein n=1 Tax=Tetrapyrgos nigripes TaxID=182062 RepID=A0A8H5GU49_9AGAR|nr:hypothetical protein D9758_004237 [Tetrapyrgos nigripes]